MSSGGNEKRRRVEESQTPRPETRLITVHPSQLDSSTSSSTSNSPISISLKPAVDALKAGNLVAFPTETVYGLGANALDSSAVSKIFAAKGRPADNPLIVHIADRSQLSALIARDAEPTAGSATARLMEKFWPGPLTLLFARSPQVPNETTASLDTVAVRMPAHPVARALINESGLPLAAPSANLSGRPSPTRAQHVLDDLNGMVSVVIDVDGAMNSPADGSLSLAHERLTSVCSVGVESTVVDARREPPVLLRPGGVSLEALKGVVPDIEVYDATKHGNSQQSKPATPGLKYRHYAPNAQVVLFPLANSTEHGLSSLLQMRKAIDSEARALLAERTVAPARAGSGSATPRIGVITTNPVDDEIYRSLFDQLRNDFSSDQLSFHHLNSGKEGSVSQGLFAALRSLDSDNVDTVLIESMPEINEGFAVMNRLKKAALKK